MPSWELFAAQSQKYRDAVLPPGISARLVVEAGVAQGWERYVGEHGDIISVEGFGASAPGEVVMQKYGFTVENVCKRAMALMKKGKKR
jgi:transketolase